MQWICSSNAAAAAWNQTWRPFHWTFKSPERRNESFASEIGSPISGREEFRLRSITRVNATDTDTNNTNGTNGTNDTDDDTDTSLATELGFFVVSVPADFGPELICDCQSRTEKLLPDPKFRALGFSERVSYGGRVALVGNIHFKRVTFVNELPNQFSLYKN